MKLFILILFLAKIANQMIVLVIEGDMFVNTILRVDERSGRHTVSWLVESISLVLFVVKSSCKA
jgi:hypothetical protein